MAFKLTIGAVFVGAASLSFNAHAALIDLPFTPSGDSYLNVVDYFSGAILLPSLITSGGLLYEDTDGTGALTINSSGDIAINDAMLATNNDGSLHVNGTINFITLGFSSTFTGDMAITYSLVDDSNAAQFNYSPIANGSNYNGLLIIDGPLAGYLLDFNTKTVFSIMQITPFRFIHLFQYLPQYGYSVLLFLVWGG